MPSEQICFEPEEVETILLEHAKAAAAQNGKPFTEGRLQISVGSVATNPERVSIRIEPLDGDYIQCRKS